MATCFFCLLHGAIMVLYATNDPTEFPNSTTIDFSPLAKIPKTHQPFVLKVQLMDDSGIVVQILHFKYEPETASPDAAADIFEASLEGTNWGYARKKNVVTVYSRKYVQKGMVILRPVTDVRFEGKVGGAARVPRITTTGNVRVTVVD